MADRSLKICVLAAARSNHTYVQCGILRDFGHHVTLVSPDKGDCPDGVKYISCAVDNANGVIGKIRWLYKVFQKVRKVDADVFHAHYAAELTTWMAWLVDKKPLVISCLGGDVLFDEQGSLGALGRWLTKRSLLGANFVTVVSNHLGKAVEHFGVPPHKMKRVVWGVNRDIFHQLNDENTQRDLWNVSKDAFVIFSPRMLKPLYNQLVMIEALKQVVAENNQAMLVLSTYNQDDNYRSLVEDRIEKLDLSAHVRFAPPMNQQEMMLSYNAADIVLSLAPTDGTPVSVMEAMACGTPVVMSDLERYKEFFTHKESGWFTKIDSSEAAAGITSLITDTKLYATLKTGGANVVTDKADLHSQTKLLEEISFQLLASK